MSLSLNKRFQNMKKGDIFKDGTTKRKSKYRDVLENFLANPPASDEVYAIKCKDITERNRIVMGLRQSVLRDEIPVKVKCKEDYIYLEKIDHPEQ